MSAGSIVGRCVLFGDGSVVGQKALRDANGSWFADSFVVCSGGNAQQPWKPN